LEEINQSVPTKLFIDIKKRENMKIVSKVCCVLCKREYSTSAFGNHKNSKTCSIPVSNKKSHIIPHDLKCEYCNKECKNRNSYAQHVITCKLNLNRRSTPFHSQEFQESYTDNQYTKAERLGLPKPIISEETKQKLSKSTILQNFNESEETKQRRINTIHKRIEEGTWHTSYNNGEAFEYNGLKLDSSWEVKYVEFLDKMEILWIRTKDSFPYMLYGKSHRYFPDFYLPETEEYIEIKGYKTERDEAKWKYFPKDKKLTILFGTELKELGINI
jgi:hypothetical protein